MKNGDFDVDLFRGDCDLLVCLIDRDLSDEFRAVLLTAKDKRTLELLLGPMMMEMVYIACEALAINCMKYLELLDFILFNNHTKKKINKELCVTLIKSQTSEEKMKTFLEYFEKSW